MFKSINTNISIDMVILGLSHIITCQLEDMPSIFKHASPCPKSDAVNVIIIISARRLIAW
jgi:hypothetical protein